MEDAECRQAHLIVQPLSERRSNEEGGRMAISMSTLAWCHDDDDDLTNIFGSFFGSLGYDYDNKK